MKRDRWSSPREDTRGCSDRTLTGPPRARSGTDAVCFEQILSRLRAAQPAVRWCRVRDGCFPLAGAGARRDRRLLLGTPSGTALGAELASPRRAGDSAAGGRQRRQTPRAAPGRRAAGDAAPAESLDRPGAIRRPPRYAAAGKSGYCGAGEAAWPSRQASSGSRSTPPGSAPRAWSYSARRPSTDP